MQIAFTGGGTGGHIFPIVAIARTIERMATEAELVGVRMYYLGPEADIPDAFAAEGIIFKRVIAGKARRYFSLLNFLDFFKTAIGIVQALWKLFVIMPDVVFSKGGYGSFPTLFVARIYRIPVIIHESDAVPGRVNQWAAKWATSIAISFPSAAKYFPKERTALTGIPIRYYVTDEGVDEAREALGTFSSRPIIFILGGSQGSRIINQTVVQILPDLTARYEVIHQSGQREFEDIRLDTTTMLKNGNAAYYHLSAFLNEQEMRAAYLLADLIVSRAGATTLFEVAAWAKPAIVIPLKNSAQDHQRENAFTYGAKGAAVVIEEDNLTHLVLLNEIRKLMDDPERRAKIAEAARAFARTDAAETIAKEIITVGLH